MSIAEKLKEARGDKSSLEVCEAVGISRSAIKMYESGARVPRDEIKVKLAKYYNTSVQDLFFDTDCHNSGQNDAESHMD